MSFTVHDRLNMSTNEIRAYALTRDDGKRIQQHALEILKSHLPVCIPIYRRLQFGRFLDATALLTNIPPGSNPGENEPWLFAFADRSCRPETEVWMFGSWEVSTDEAHDPAIDTLIRNLFVAMKDLGVPTSIHQDVLDHEAKKAEEKLELGTDRMGFSRNDYVGHLADPNIVLWGGTHERTVPILQRLGLLSLKFKTGIVPNYTFIWDVDALPPPRQLPSGLKWGELQPQHFSTVRLRTQIPRQDRTLAVLPNIGIFEDRDGAQPIAWGFVGLDASLTTLHVEPEWRGQGLAKAVTTKLFKEKMGLFWQHGEERWAYGFVVVGNTESEGMCRSLGGKTSWKGYWVRVDLGAV